MSGVWRHRRHSAHPPRLPFVQGSTSTTIWRRIGGGRPQSHDARPSRILTPFGAPLEKDHHPHCWLHHGHQAPRVAERRLFLSFTSSFVHILGSFPSCPEEAQSVHGFETSLRAHNQHHTTFNAQHTHRNTPTKSQRASNTEQHNESGRGAKARSRERGPRSSKACRSDTHYREESVKC